MRSTSLKNHFIPILEKLRNRKKIETQILNKSNFPRGKMIRNANSANSTNLTLTIIPESDVLLGTHRVEAGEPSVASDHLP